MVPKGVELVTLMGLLPSNISSHVELDKLFCGQENTERRLYDKRVHDKLYKETRECWKRERLKG